MGWYSCQYSYNDYCCGKYRVWRLAAANAKLGHLPRQTAEPVKLFRASILHAIAEPFAMANANLGQLPRQTAEPVKLFQASILCAIAEPSRDICHGKNRCIAPPIHYTLSHVIVC